jgi:hypothetical protein
MKKVKAAINFEGYEVSMSKDYPRFGIYFDATVPPQTVMIAICQWMASII